ncbi:(deoxy)nucleoside triphosphate pyrophosphohydrolase [Fusibacter sp. JL298sf-3]
MKKIEVVAAVIERDGCYLATQRDNSPHAYIAYKYEFPGGKIEPDETQEEALIREIDEELSLTIQVHEKMITVSHQYPDFHLIMHVYRCSSDSDRLVLKAHVGFKWLHTETLDSVEWAAADVPVVEMLKKRA